jgi:hypothetical protein
MRKNDNPFVDTNKLGILDIRLDKIYLVIYGKKIE